MKGKAVSVLLFLSTGLLFVHHSLAQVTLGASPYAENFNGIGGGLPVGWTVRTTATSSNLGTPATLVTSTTAWNSSTGNFRNVASAIGLTSSSSATFQNGSTDRALAVRQTGSLGDPGAAFLLQLNNTTGLYNFSLSFKLQSLDGGATGRTTTWKVEYGFGNSPVSFTQVPTNPSTLTTTLSAAAWGSTDATVNFGAALDDNSNTVWIRIVTLALATGASNRPTSAIDDIKLSYSNGDITPPAFELDYPRVSNITSSGFDLRVKQNEPGKTFFVVVPDGAMPPSSLQVKNNQNASGEPLSSGLYGAINIISSSMEYSLSVTGLLAETGYDIYFVAEDNFYNLQVSPMKLDIRTNEWIDVAPPNFISTYPKIASITKTGFSILTKLDEPGKTFFVVLEKGSVAPTSIQVSSGLDGNGSVLNSNLIGTISVNTAQVEFSGQVNSLNPESMYDLYVVAQDDAGNLLEVPSKITVTTEAMKVHQTIAFDVLATKTFGDTPFDFAATSSSGMAVSYTSSDPTVLLINGKTATILKSGSIVITASQTGDELFYPATDVTQNLDISKANQVITFNPVQSKSFGSPALTLMAGGGASGQPVTFTSSNTGTAIINGNLLTIVGVGTTTIKAAQAGNENYNAAIDVSQPFTVNKANQMITFNALPASIFGDTPFELVATGGDSGVPIIFTSSKPSVAAIIGNTVTIVGPGTSKITASQAGNTNYSAAADVAQTLSVSKADQTIAFGALPPVTFGDIPFNLTASGGRSGLPVTITSSKPSVATINGNTVTIIGAGTSTITAKQVGNANYNAAVDVIQTLTVNKAGQSISFSTVPQKTFGDAPISLSAAGGASGLPVTFSISSAGVATASGATLTIVGAGIATIIAKQAGNTNYNAATEVTQTLIVIKASQSILFTALAAKTFGDPSFSLIAKGGGSALPVTFVSSNTGVASISNSTLTMVGAGTTTITAIQSGNGNYSAADNVTQILTVNKGKQSIIFSSIADKQFGDPSFTVTGTASSGLPINFTTTSDKISIKENQIAIIKPGRVSVTANQAGSASFNPATSIDQSFCVKPQKPVIAISENSEAATLTSSSGSGNQWYINGEAISESTKSMLTAVHEGIYKVQVTEDDCVSEFSEGMPIIITEESAPSQGKIKAYPNPVVGHLELRGLEELETAQIFDMAGAMTSIVLEKKGEYHLADVRGLAKGVYVLRVNKRNKIHQIKFVKE